MQHKEILKNLKTEWQIWAMYVLFIIISVFGMAHHEMWRDELQAWMVARDADTFPQLFQNVKYEGNPALWHILLFFITRFTSVPLAMQILHMGISFCFVFLFLKYSGFSNINKLLFILGYFIVFEYNVISRSYSLGILLLFTILVLFRNKTKNRLIIFILLALLVNTSIYGLIISGVFVFLYLIDLFFPEDKLVSNIKNQKRKQVKKVYIWPKLNTAFYTGLTIYLLGALLSAIQIYPEPNNTFPVSYPDSLLDFERMKLLSPSIISAFLPIPDFTGLHFWNTNYIHWEQSGTTLFILTLCVFLSAISLLHNRNAFVFYLVSSLGLLFIYYYSGMVWWRYTGNLFIIFVAAHWLKNYFDESIFQKSVIKGISKFGKKISLPFLTIVLSVHAIGGFVAISKDYRQTFAAGKKTSEYIVKHKLSHLSIMGNMDFLVSSVSGFLDKPLFYPSRMEYGSFIIWDDKRNGTGNQEIMKSMEKLASEGRDSFLMIQSAAIRDASTNKVFTEGNFTPTLSFQLLQSFDDSIVVENEGHYIYLIKMIKQR